MRIVAFKFIFSKKRGLCICLGCEFYRYAFLTRLFFSMKRDHENIFRFMSILFLRDFNVIIFLVWMGVIGMLRGYK